MVARVSADFWLHKLVEALLPAPSSPLKQRPAAELTPTLQGSPKLVWRTHRWMHNNTSGASLTFACGPRGLTHCPKMAAMINDGCGVRAGPPERHLKLCIGGI